MFVIIPHINIKGVNMMQTPSVLTPVPLFASTMFAHAIGAELGSTVTEVGVVFHQAWPDVEYFPNKSKDGKRVYLNPSLINKRGACGYLIKGEPNGGDYASGTKSPDGMAYQAGATATVKISLLLHFTNGVELAGLIKKMKTAKIGGGQVTHFGEIKVVDDNIHSAIQSLPSGYFIEDASAVVQKRLEGGESITEAVLTRVKPSEEIESGWYVPVNIGYSPITSFQQRGGVRDDLPHAFAEPVVGLIKLTSVNKIKAQENSPSLWRHEWMNGEQDVSLFRIYQPTQVN